MLGSIGSTEITRIPTNLAQLTGDQKKPKPANPAADNTGTSASAPVSEPTYSKKQRTVIKSIRVAYPFSGNQAINTARQFSPLRIEIKGVNLPTETLKFDIPNIKIEKIISVSVSAIIVEARAGKKDNLSYRRVKLLSEDKKVAEKTILLRLIPTPKCPDNPSNKRLRELGICK